MSEALTFLMGKFPAVLPGDRRYCRNHMWCLPWNGQVSRFGFTSYAVRLMQDVYFLDWQVNAADVLQLKQLFGRHHGVFIASPEYNASITPLLKNAIDWISVVRERDEPQLYTFQNRAFALGAASPGRSGGMQSLITLRQVLAIGCRAFVVPEQVTIPNAGEAFDASDELKDPRSAAQLKLVVRKLIDYARMMGDR